MAFGDIGASAYRATVPEFPISDFSLEVMFSDHTVFMFRADITAGRGIQPARF